MDVFTMGLPGVAVSLPEPGLPLGLFKWGPLLDGLKGTPTETRQFDRFLDGSKETPEETALLGHQEDTASMRWF